MSICAWRRRKALSLGLFVTFCAAAAQDLGADSAMQGFSPAGANAEQQLE